MCARGQTSGTERTTAVAWSTSTSTLEDGGRRSPPCAHLPRDSHDPVVPLCAQRVFSHALEKKNQKSSIVQKNRHHLGCFSTTPHLTRYGGGASPPSFFDATHGSPNTTALSNLSSGRGLSMDITTSRA